MAKKPPVFFATNKEGDLFVRLDAVMNPWCAMADGLDLVIFPDNKTLYYLPIDTAISWCQKEAKSHDREKYEMMVSVMERAKKEQAEYLSKNP